MAQALLRAMTGRRQDEEHRAATPLELFFDLCFVVAVAQAGTALHHAVGEGHVAHGVGAYLMVFFAIWWAWMNFTWFASAYDTDDVPYRLAVLVQITGSLIMAAGVTRAFDREDFTVIVIGYVVMRLAQIAQWLRAAASHPARRATALRYAAGLFAVQVLWVSLLFVPSGWRTAAWVVFALADLSVPAFAERAGSTSWHPHHIAERYGLFTIIVLGESVTAATLAFKDAFDVHVTAALLTTLVGGILIMFSLWWLYFGKDAAPRLTGSRAAFVWGYGHYVVFAAGAAVGAGLSVAAAHAVHEGHAGRLLSSAAVTVPTAVFLLMIYLLHREGGRGAVLITTACALVLASTFVPGSVLVTGAVLAGVVALTQVERSPAS
ncbi:low temperature requirement protein A [Actinocorallia longicatena]|uniref:Low temperature requirement protein A n=1 Tax=Actinocorallia longicatena TaxID=111803 RepID=A0ABP6Q469_9ACTN